ncbi:MAG: hypothetical protein M3136_04325 [Thermoproteota archaeon]|nr:hypothetical protein [Thermoproteota archaeon]
MSNILSKFSLYDLSNALRNGFHSAFSIVSAILNDGKLVIPCYCQKKKRKRKRKKRKKYEEKESENLSTSITVVLEQHKEQEEAIIVQK